MFRTGSSCSRRHPAIRSLAPAFLAGALTLGPALPASAVTSTGTTAFAGTTAFGGTTAFSGVGAGTHRPAGDKPVIGDPEVRRIDVAAEADGTAVSLDTAIYSPKDGSRHPALLLAHGFGGSRADLDAAAREAAGRGYVVMAYSARGFGDSGGRIHLQDPQIDGADLRRLIDVLAGRDDVQSDGPSDPRVGVAGASYGGAAALVAAGVDPRVDAITAGATWNDLATAFFPNHAVGPAKDQGVGSSPAELSSPGKESETTGVLKRRWASQLFGWAVAGSGRQSAARPGSPSPAPSGPATTPSGTATAPSGTATTGPGPANRGRPGTPPTPSVRTTAPGSPTAPSEEAVCGRFERTLCRLFLETSRTGVPSPQLITELQRRGPGRTLSRINAPTLLVQGTQDSLFGLDQADATARTLAANKVPVAVQWFTGGHASSAEPPPSSTYLPWFDAYLRSSDSAAQRRQRALPVPGFSYSAPAFRRGTEAREIPADRYPGLPGAPSLESRRLPFADRSAQGRLLSPLGGDPAASSSVPGVGDGNGKNDVLGSLSYRLAALPGQHVAFDTTPVSAPTTVVGAPRLRLKVTSSTTDATFFVSLWRLSSGSASPAGTLVSPVRVATKPGVPTTVDVALPASTYSLDQGTSWRVLVSASDSAYATPTDARRYDISLDQDALTLPVLPGAKTPGTETDREIVGLLIALALTGIAITATAVVLRRRRTRSDNSHTRPELTDVPLSVMNLVKTYADGHRAVDDVSWKAERGQVVGLLGPNGAGKTTTIRMIAGLIRPDSGDIHVHGRPVHAGSSSLSGIGALIEGPGFLPHLSGMANLKAYWAATGRPMSEAHFEEALAVAALGGAVDRPVRSYSQGMRQRLGIAQAMLGMPEVLLLDEPTNGLDPPQIAAMRPVLRRYAETGRTVVVSSHMLAEVEMTCTHVVVMNRGRVVLSGSVPDLIDSADTTVVEVAGGAVAARTVAYALRWSSRHGRARLGGRRGPALPGPLSVSVESEGAQASLVIHSEAPRADIVAAVVAAGGRVVGVSGRRHLEEVFLGVIGDEGADTARQVRPR